VRIFAEADEADGDILPNSIVHLHWAIDTGNEAS
jgi:hypothetical protein